MSLKATCYEYEDMHICMLKAKRIKIKSLSCDPSMISDKQNNLAQPHHAQDPLITSVSSSKHFTFLRIILISPDTRGVNVNNAVSCAENYNVHHRENVTETMTIN